MTSNQRTGLIRSLAAAAMIAAAGAAHAGEPLKILPLGDSITQAEINRASYRYPLWKKLVDAGIPFDFVGSLEKQQDRYSQGTPPQPDYKGREFDRDHEGHFGWNINEIIKGRDFDNGSGSGRLEQWVEGYQADIALIHLGTNDAFNRHSNESSVEELEEVIRILREDNPRITILLAKLIPTVRKAGDTEAVESLNREIPEIAEDMSTEQSPVIIVDHFQGFDAEEDTYDGVHPNAAGEEKMAQRWFQAIMEVARSN